GQVTGADSPLSASVSAPAITYAAYRTLLSNSPSRTPPMKASHSVGVNARTEPVGFLESRTPTVPSAADATPTHFGPPPLRRDLRQLVKLRSCITVVSYLVRQFLRHGGEEVKALRGFERGVAEALVQGQVVADLCWVCQYQVRGHRVDGNDDRITRVGVPIGEERRPRHRVAEDTRGEREHSDRHLLAVLTDIDEVLQLGGDDGRWRGTPTHSDRVDDYLVGRAARSRHHALPGGTRLQGASRVELLGVGASVRSRPGFGEGGDLEQARKQSHLILVDAAGTGFEVGVPRLA